MSAIDTLLRYDEEKMKGGLSVSVYDPFGQGYMHDWRLEEAVKEGVRRALRGLDKASPEEREALLQEIRALAFQLESAREDAEVYNALRRLAQYGDDL